MGLQHTDREYEAELRRLREQILLMGAKVEEMLAASMRSLVERDSDLARRMIEFDHQINRCEVDCDELCLRILARRQPVASDLRFLTIALKLVTDLERIGDLGVNICERAIELNAEPPLKPYIDLPKMAEEARAMVRDALDAFVAGDAERARQVIERDSIVDAYYAQVFRELLTYMMEDARNIYRATRVQSIAKYIERIGDHATNLAEMVVFMAKGKDIRHTGRLEEPNAKPVPHGVVFLGDRNAGLSQMAEGWARKLMPPHVRVWSAGAEPAQAVYPAAVRVMREVGIDISWYRPKGIPDVPLGEVDLAIALYDQLAPRDLPAELGWENWRLADPAMKPESEQEIESAFRAARNNLRERIEALIAAWI